MEVVKKYSAFDPQRQTIYQGILETPFNCINTGCDFKGGASFDTNGNILVPSSDARFWLNNALPSSIHPRACCFDIQINGVTSSPNYPWYQMADAINGSYSSHYLWYWDDYEMLFNLPLCDANNPIVRGGYTRVVCSLHIGQDGISFIDNSMFPSGWVPDGYTYKHKDREVENRPKLYVWAITRFVTASSYTNFNQLQGGFVYSPFYDPVYNPVGEFESDCLPPIYFKTNLGEFKGDYTGSCVDYYDHIYDITRTRCTLDTVSYTNECQNPKPYHGDLDLRNLSFTVESQDRWPYTNSPTGSWSEGDLEYGRQVADFTGTTIRVTAASTQDVEDMTSNCGYTSYGFPFYTQESTTIRPCDENITYATTYVGTPGFAWANGVGVNLLPEINFNNLLGFEGRMGALSEYMTVNVGGVTSVAGTEHQSDAGADTCYTADDINGEYKLAVENSNGNFWYSLYPNGLAYSLGLPYTEESYRSAITNRTYYSDFHNVCCNCGATQSGCITSMSATLSASGAHNDNGEVASDLTVNIAGHTFYHEFDNWGTYARTMNFNGQTVNPSLKSSIPEYRDVYDFSGATISVTFGSVDKIICLPEQTVCSYFANGKGPDYLYINISDGWEDTDSYYSDSGYASYDCNNPWGWMEALCESYLVVRCVDSIPAGAFLYGINCSYIQNYTIGDCRHPVTGEVTGNWFDTCRCEDQDWWPIPDYFDCATNHEHFYRYSSETDSYVKHYYITPLEYCEGFVPVGEYVLDRLECLNNSNYIGQGWYGGCYWGYGIPDYIGGIEEQVEDIDFRWLVGEQLPKYWISNTCREEIRVWIEDDVYDDNGQKLEGVCKIKATLGLMTFESENITMLEDGPDCDYYITNDMLDGLELTCVPISHNLAPDWQGGPTQTIENCDNNFWSFNGTITLSTTPPEG